MNGHETVVAALEGAGHTLRRVGDNAVTTCPAHADARPSLSVKAGEGGKALVYCHAGCSYQDVLGALGLEPGDVLEEYAGEAYVDRYTYVDEQGRPLTRVLRKEPKGFTQESYSHEEGRWVAGLFGARRVLYNLPAVREAARLGGTVYLVEGEKDADNLTLTFDVVATTNLGGATAWRPEYVDSLQGAGRVVVVADNDDVGRRAAQARADSLADAGIPVDVVLPRAGKDATDHIFEGFGLDDFVPLEGLDVFEPLEWTEYEPPATQWLLEPFVPAGKRVLAFGANGSLKSLWAMWLAAHLARDGHDVAYFSLEMTASEAQQRIKQLDPPPEHFKLFRSFDFWNEDQVAVAKKKLAGYALVVVDSWSAAHNLSRRRDSNAEVAALDAEVFLPMVEATGATLLIIDNTGHDWWQDGKRVPVDHARGASAKGDKMDYTLFFSRPVEADNYMTELEVKKVRIDYPKPAGVRIKTPRDRIEFYYTTERGTLDYPMWPGLQVRVADVGVEAASVDSIGDQPQGSTASAPTSDVAGTPEHPRPEAKTVAGDPRQRASTGNEQAGEGSPLRRVEDRPPAPDVAEQLRLARVQDDARRLLREQSLEDA